MFQRWILRVREGAAGEGAGGGGGSSSSSSTKKEVAPNVASLIARHGSAEQALAVVAADNWTLRNSRREWRERAETAEGKLKPGTVLLSPDDAKEWEKMKGFGKASEVEAKLKERDTLAAKDAERTVADQANVAARQYGYNAEALASLVSDKKLTLTVKDRSGAKEGEPTKDILIREPGEGKSEVHITDYVEKLPKFYQAALAAKEDGQGSSSTDATGNGVRFVRQSSTDSGRQGNNAKGDLTQQLKDRYPSPSERAAATTKT